MSTRPLISTSLGKSEERKPGGHEAKAKAQKIDCKRSGKHGGYGEASEQKPEQEDPRRHLRHA
jgi:hypothetical protein